MNGNNSPLRRGKGSRTPDARAIRALPSPALAKAPKGTRCNGITPAQHAGGPGPNPQRVHASAGDRARFSSLAMTCSSNRPLPASEHATNCLIGRNAKPLESLSAWENGGGRVYECSGVCATSATTASEPPKGNERGLDLLLLASPPPCGDRTCDHTLTTRMLCPVSEGGDGCAQWLFLRKNLWPGAISEHCSRCFRVGPMRPTPRSVGGFCCAVRGADVTRILLWYKYAVACFYVCVVCVCVHVSGRVCACACVGFARKTHDPSPAPQFSIQYDGSRAGGSMPSPRRTGYA